MKTRWLQQIVTSALALALTASSLFAQTKSSSKLKPLDEKNDPMLVGKRDINKGQISFYSLDREVAIGRQLAYEIDQSSPLVTDPIINEFVNRVAQNIVLHSDAKVPFTIKVLDSQEVNAFALPGGFLYVNRGLLEAAENEAEVAGVLAHEIAHVTARHGIEQASKGQLLNYASIPLIFLGGLGGYIIQQAVGVAVPLTFLKFSRGAEKEADRLGAQYMWASGYDPHALVTFFEKLQAQEQKKPGTLAKVFRTHPLTSDRIKEVGELIVQFPDRSEYQVSTSEFNQLRTRLMAARGNNRPINSGDDRRPTLKRRPQSDNGDVTSDPDTSDRPVLKRRDSSSNDPASSSDDTGKPVLKRRDSSASPNESSEPASDDSGKPVLKRREGSAATEKTETPAKPANDTSERPKLKRREDPEKPPSQ